MRTRILVICTIITNFSLLGQTKVETRYERQKDGTITVVRNKTTISSIDSVTDRLFGETEELNDEMILLLETNGAVSKDSLSRQLVTTWPIPTMRECKLRKTFELQGKEVVSFVELISDPLESIDWLTLLTEVFLVVWVVLIVWSNPTWWKGLFEASILVAVITAIFWFNQEPKGYSDKGIPIIIFMTMALPGALLMLARFSSRDDSSEAREVPDILILFAEGTAALLVCLSVIHERITKPDLPNVSADIEAFTGSFHVLCRALVFGLFLRIVLREKSKLISTPRTQTKT